MDITKESELLSAALKYASMGWPVFPVWPGTKNPCTPNGFYNAKVDPGAIKHWWGKWPDSGIAIATGNMSGILVIDLDYKPEEGKDGPAELRAWEHETGYKLPETITAVSGSGGQHLYYRYDPTKIKVESKINLIWGIDVRADGSCIIAPPSIHECGREYYWDIDPDDMPMAEADEAVFALLSLGEKKKPDSMGTQGERFSIPTTIPCGERNDTLFRLACSLQAQGLPDTAIRAAIKEVNAASCVKPVDGKEAETIVESALRYRKGELSIITKDVPVWHEPRLTMQQDKNGVPTDRPAQTIANAEEAITFDKDLYGRLAYNDLTYCPYVYGTVPWREHCGWREWDNFDDSNLRSYIEAKYHLKSAEKTMDALQNVVSRRIINPIKEMLEEAHERWDGNAHIETLLPAMMGADKTEYTTEVMKLFLLGAIARTYVPGCKYDYVPILVGPQGIGKSTFLRLLAFDDKCFTDSIGSLEGDKAKETLRGAWIVELSELLAMRRTKDVEACKSFITSRTDIYRAPYQRRTEQRPRRCVFAGTTNSSDFLTDRTGNRRFLPIECGKHMPTIDIFGDEAFARSEILQAWGEAMDIYLRTGSKIKLVLPRHLQSTAVKAQENYLEEDPRIGIIQEWLDIHTDITRVCAPMLWREALEHLYDEAKRSDINGIHAIMQRDVTGWVQKGKQRIAKYGVQRCYERINDFVECKEGEIPFTD